MSNFNYNTMAQEQEELLLKDLCARLPYGVWIERKLKSCKFGAKCMLHAHDINAIKRGVFDFYKPYLFPLSSMTEEQKQEYTYIVNYISPDDTDNWKEGEFIYVEQFTQLMHFYYINHLDYMGLIPMGLAIDATGLNIY